MKYELIGALFTSMIIASIGFSVLFLMASIISYPLFKLECNEKYASFENKYKLFGGCQIKTNNKWIPVDSYYFNEKK